MKHIKVVAQATICRDKGTGCEECEYRYYSEPENIGYCQCVEGIRRKLKPGDGCSCGKRKE